MFNVHLSYGHFFFSDTLFEVHYERQKKKHRHKNLNITLPSALGSLGLTLKVVFNVHLLYGHSFPLFAVTPANGFTNRQSSGVLARFVRTRLDQTSECRSLTSLLLYRWLPKLRFNKHTTVLEQTTHPYKHKATRATHNNTQQTAHAE